MFCALATCVLLSCVRTPAADPIGCEVNTDCPPLERCVAGACLPSVISSKAECDADRPCADGTTCLDGVCADPFIVEVGCHEEGGPECSVGERCDEQSGMCVAAALTCDFDASCSPPNTVCENGDCVPSCLSAGGISCAPGTACSPQTGRCVLLRDQCAIDADCGPPAAVCEGGRCVPSCGQNNGVTCAVAEICELTTTGRCAPGDACGTDVDCGSSDVCLATKCSLPCTSPSASACAAGDVCNQTSGHCEPAPQSSCNLDAECGPPTSVCDMQNNVCVAGCLPGTCTGGNVCDSVTGRCAVPAGSPLNAACALDADCASDVCFDFGGGAGRRCVSACGSTADCPNGFTCHPHDGSHLCISGGLFQGTPAFTDPSGGTCSDSGACHSGLCTAGSCNERCTENADCASYGDRCSWSQISSDRYEQACSGSPGPDADGASCSRDSDCQSGVCFRGPGTTQARCSVHCNTTNDCSAGQVCGVLDYSICTSGNTTTCAAWRIQSLTICIDEIDVGSGSVGASCSQSSDCRSLLCNPALQMCTDICGTDVDCPTGWACKPDVLTQLPGAQPLRFNVCLPR